MDYQTVQHKANAAITQHIGCWLSTEATETIRTQYGAATCTLVLEVYRFALGQPADWAATAPDTQLSNAADAIRAAYPFLTPANVGRLVTCFAYSWK